MKSGDQNAPRSKKSLLHLQLVFALGPALIFLPIDLVRIWTAGPGAPRILHEALDNLVGIAIFGLITFCLWRWILPKLRGLLVLRLFIQVMVGLVLFGTGTLLTWSLLPHIVKAPVSLPEPSAISRVLVFWLIITGQTLYMTLGGLALESASSEHRGLSDLALSAQLEVLRNQINHHFLFNALNVIAELIGLDASRAERLVIQLADVLRYSLGASRRRLAPLSDELIAVASYLELEKARSEDKVRVESRIAADVGELQVPPLLIQPLVENAVRHGLQNGTRPGTIAISARRERDQLVISVRDDGVGVDPQQLAQGQIDGVALSNLRQRLRAYYGERASFHLTSGLGAGSVAEISLPLSQTVDQVPPRHGVVWRVFFYHLGSAIPVLLFFGLRVLTNVPSSQAWQVGWTAEAFYLVAASAAAEVKLLDLAFAGFFFTGLVAQLVGIEYAFLNFGPAWLFLFSAMVAILPQALGAEPFTSYWARRITPDWVQHSPIFMTICNDLALMWGGIYLLAAVIAATMPHSLLATLGIPAFLIVGVALPMSYHYPRIYRRRHAVRATESAGTFIRSLPTRFAQARADGLDLSVQFVVSGGEPGNYFIKVGAGNCMGGEGVLPDAILTIYSAAETWIRIGNHELTPEQALRKGWLRIRGEERDLQRFLDCFPIDARSAERPATSARAAA